MLRLTVLSDNRICRSGLGCEHGFSLFLEIDGKKILFDTGAGELFRRNAEALGIDPTSSDCVALSHGDWDHTGGLPWVGEHKTLICHPDVDRFRISRRKRTFGGLPYDTEELSQHFALQPSKEPCRISENVWFLGEIERRFDFEGAFPMWDEEEKVYPVPDDSGLAVTTPQGLVVISGCAHSGICNTVEYARKVTGIQTVRAVLGGFHLLNYDEKAEKTLAYMKQNVETIWLAHCTENVVIEAFEQALPDRCSHLGVGQVLEFK